MFVSFICSLSSILYIVTLYAIYKNKLKVNNAKSKLYKYMLGVLSILCILVIISTVLDQFDINSKLADNIMKVHWYGVIIVVSLMYFYIITFLSGTETKNVLEIFTMNKFVKISTVIVILLFIGSFFVPFTLRLGDDYNFIPGAFGYYIQADIVIKILMILIFYKWFNKNTEDKLDKKIIFGLGLIFSIFLFFQLSVREVSFYGIAYISLLYFLYSTSENPDLEMITGLKKLNDEIIASSNAKTDIILNMSHDIRSPMNAIVNYSAELAEIKELNKENIENNINNIIVAGKNLLNILDDILEISGREQHAGLDTYNMNDIVADLKNITESRIGNKPIKLELNVDPGLPQLLMGNAAKMYRILMNILSNSAKYTDVGKISLNIVGERINNENVMLHIKVSDTGFGIRDEDKPKVFSEFSRLKDATNQKIEGTGLGIANTKKNVEILGGKIWFDSTYGAGTTFFVDIPQQICSNKTLEEYNREKQIGGKKLLDCGTLIALVVDENLVNVNVTSRLLQKYNFKVDYCHNGKDCIKKIKEGNYYDIIFMDLLMDNMEGDDILKVLKYLNKSFNVPPIIALTANAIGGAREEYLKKGFDEYLSKPIDMNELDRVINLFLKNKVIIDEEKNYDKF